MSSEKITCPKCNFDFTEMYSRTFACGDCRQSVLGDCGFVKCPNCEYEWPKTEFPAWMRKKYQRF